MQVTNMGRVLFLASLATILLIGNVNGVAAQGRGGMGANGGVAPGAGAHGSAMAAPARSAAGHITSSPGSHLAIPRSPSGQLMPRRAGTTLRATGRFNGSTSTRTRQFRSSRGAGLDFSEDSNVPGLGFDAVHVAATRGNRAGVGRDRDRGRGRRNEFGVLFPFFDGGGYYVPTGPDISGDVPGDGQAVDDAEDQGPGPDDRPYDRGSANRPPAEQPGPQANVPEYVFVRRDGTVFFAVAYSWDQGSLRYISSEGTRRSVSRDTLDLKATQQFNEERGLTFRSPA
ncbi:MAG TPA: hypothetical protein VK818_04855 [Methylomirabilota bacterium]|nr:hypothetical protein [Methylomirabilota bacterium]